MDTHGRALPTLHGVVVDEAVHPLPGVIVRFLGTDVNVTTDKDGAYEFHEPVPKAQVVLVSAFLPGYTPKTQQIQVSGHASASLDFALAEDPFRYPFSQVLDQRGSVGCHFVADVAGQTHQQSCVTEKSDEHLPPNLWELYFSRDLQGVVVEVFWTPDSDLSQALEATLSGPVAGGHGAENVLVRQAGTSPLRLEVPQEVASTFGDWTGVRLTMNVTPQASSPLGASVDQAFHAFATVFYGDPAPAGYTLPQ